MKALLAMPEGLQHRMFTSQQLERLRALVDVDTGHAVPDLTAAPDELLAQAEVLLTGWGSPLIDAAALQRMPRLRAIVHTAGTVRSVVGDAVWERGGIVVTSATEANAVPVAEFTLAQILLAGKQARAQEQRYHAERRVHPASEVRQVGNYGSVIGLIGASRIGVLVAKHLQRFDVDVLITDPFVGEEEIALLGAQKVEPEALYARADVVSLHAPDVPSTRGIVSRELLALMRDGATFINTARPALVDIDALRNEVVSGRLRAVLDVHDDLSPSDPLWSASGAIITPHIAGSQGNELHRMGEFALEEVRRVTAGKPPRFPVDASRLEFSA